MKPLALVLAGVGSRCRQDDAIGLMLVESFGDSVADADKEEKLWEARLWEHADGATIAHELLELDADVLLVDCADMGLAPGEHRFFNDSQLRQGIMTGQSTASTHGFGVTEAVQLARVLGFDAAVHIMGIQPSHVGYGTGLSSDVEQRLPELQQALMRGVADLLAPRLPC